MNTGTFIFRTKHFLLKLIKLPWIETTFYIKHSKSRTSMMITWTDSKARGTALAERSTIEGAPMTLNANSNALTKNVKNSTAQRGL